MTQTADPAPKIRRYREADLGALYDVCVRTADPAGTGDPGAVAYLGRALTVRERPNREPGIS